MSQRVMHIQSYAIQLSNRHNGQPPVHPMYVLMKGRVDGAAWMAEALFMDDPVVDAINEMEAHPEGPRVFVWLPASHFTPLVDLLRNEKPVYIRWDTESRHVTISTLDEPVGEGELHLPKPAPGDTDVRSAKRAGKARRKKR
ncbi:MAG: hypothetical protein JNM90_13405 [Burkholderiales bacterium]|nr:hypothetical protein [Burkholderiales bacterium]